MGAQQTDKFPASAQVVGKLINGIAVTGSFGKVPLELTLLGDDSKHQLPYIAIGDGSVPLQTVEHAYALPYDDSYLRSSDLKTAGVSTFPSISAGDVIYNSTMFDIEFSRDTEDLFKVYAEDDEDQNTNIFSVSIPTANINNHIDWRTLGFELDEEGKPKSAPIKNSSSANRVYNVDEGYIDDNYFESAPIIIEYNYMQHVVFNVNSAWSQTTAAKAFSIEEQTSFENLPVNTTDKLMKIVDKGSSRYFALSINNMIYSPSDVSDGKMTLDISQYFSQVIRTLSIYELKATEEDETRVITYSIKQVGAICYNTFNIGLSNAYEDVILKPVSYTPAFVFNFDKIGTLHDYTDTIVPTSITSEADMPDYILQPFDIQTREDLQSFDLMWVVAGMPALDFKGFTPSAPHTIESNKELTITVNNHVDWTATNALTLKGGKWIVNDLSASSPGAIVVGDGSSVVAKGWQNKYLSQLGAPSSIQKNLQTIYDALGNVVQRVPINDTVEYAFNVNGIADSTMKQFETLIASLLQTQVHGGDNRISQYTIEIVTPGDDGFGKVAVKFSLPSKDGKNTKEIIADVSLNLITNTNAEEGTKENDYYVMHYNATSKAIKFVKSNDMSTALDANVYDGVALKLIKTASDTQGKLRLFFNNSSVVITTPLFVDDFDNGTPTTSFTEQPATAVNGRIVYKLDGIENLVLVDTVNVADMTIE